MEHQQQYDSDGELPPPGYDNTDLDATDYTTYNPSMLDNDFDSNSQYTNGSTDIIIDSLVPVLTAIDAPAADTAADNVDNTGFSHPAAAQLALSMACQDTSLPIPSGTLNVVNMSDYNGDFMLDDDRDGSPESIGAENDLERSTQLAAAIAAGSALSAVRSRSQGNPVDEVDGSIVESGGDGMGAMDDMAILSSSNTPTTTASDAATAIVGNVATGQPSAKALESFAANSLVS